MVRLGVARTLAPGAYSPRRAADELNALMSYPSYGLRAAQIAPSVAAEDGARVSADIIEALLEQEDGQRRRSGA
jgi:UDP:flavonoid glycosyltransferase YjiC (YdhE family)